MKLQNELGKARVFNDFGFPLGAGWAVLGRQVAPRRATGATGSLGRGWECNSSVIATRKDADIGTQEVKTFSHVWPCAVAKARYSWQPRVSQLDTGSSKKFPPKILTNLRTLACFMLCL